MTAGILRSIKFRDNMYRKLIKTDSNASEYSALDNNLRIYKTILRKSIRLAKANYYANRLEQHKSDMRRTWSTINDILNKNRQKKVLPSYILVKTEKIVSPVKIANQFNNFFANIGRNLSDKISRKSDKHVSTFLKQEVLSRFDFKCVDCIDVKKIIHTITAKNSCGIDAISTKLIKMIGDDIAGPLTLIINQSLSTGVFPDKLKIAKVIPLYKKDDPHLVDNFRPISLLPAISKIFEKIVFNQVYAYFDRNKLLYTSQYGFRKLHSTELASLELVDRVRLDMDSGKMPLSVFLDLSKAFDTLDHSILLQKLTHYGLSQAAIRWFSSYLLGRRQLVDFNGTWSTLTSTSTGVPQGSILGPLLFIIYMNDIHVASDKFNAIIYADDTSLLSSLCSFNVSVQRNTTNIAELSAHINLELGNIQEWLNINKLSLNVQKTKFMIFHNYQRDISLFIPEIKINGQLVERVTEFNFLGLTIDEHLNWKSHIQKVSNKVSRSIGVLNRLKKFLPITILRILYNALILPHFQFSILTWGFSPGRLNKLQKRAIRVITNSKYNAHVEPLLKRLNLLRLTDIFKINLLKMFYKFKHNQLPHYLTTMLSDPEKLHAYNTRSNPVLATPCSNLYGTEKCVRYHLPTLINDTDRNIIEKVDTHSYYGFGAYVKKITMQGYQFVCTVSDCYICQRQAPWYYFWLKLGNYLLTLYSTPLT